MQSNTSLWSHGSSPYVDSMMPWECTSALPTIWRGLIAMPVKYSKTSYLTAINHPEELESVRHIFLGGTFWGYNIFPLLSLCTSNHPLCPSFVYPAISSSELQKVSMPGKSPDLFQISTQIGLSHPIPNYWIFHPFTNQDSIHHCSTLRLILQRKQCSEISLE